MSGAYLPPLEMPQPVEEKITVLVMNWKRPANLKKIVTALDSYDEVKDIVLVVRTCVKCVTLPVVRRVFFQMTWPPAAQQETIIFQPEF